MTNPRLISHHNVITFQMKGADANMRSLVLFYQLPTHPCCTNCGTRGYWLCLCLANVQFLCNLCHSDSSIRHNHGSGFLQLHTAGWCSGVPKHSASVTLFRLCFNNSLHSHFSTINSTDPIPRRWTCVNINTFTPSAYRISTTVLCSSLVQTESVADMFHSWQQLTQWQQGWDYQCTDTSYNQSQCIQLSKVFPHTSTHRGGGTAITFWRSPILHKFWGFCSVASDNSILLRYNEEQFKQTEQCSEVHVYHYPVLHFQHNASNIYGFVRSQKMGHFMTRYIKNRIHWTICL